MNAKAGGTPREPQTRRRGRRALASALALVLGLSLAPAGVAWAEPDSGTGDGSSESGGTGQGGAGETGGTGAEVGENGSESGGSGSGSTGEPGASGTDAGSDGKGLIGQRTTGDGAEGEGETGDGTEPQGAQPLADSESVPGLALSVKVFSDGTPGTIDGGTGWDPNSNPGNDAGPKNGIVRVNDTVTYDVEYVVSSTEAENLTFSITFPKGMQITDLPGYCSENGTPRVGSAITPATPDANVTLPLTAGSIDQLQEQTLTCNMGTKSVATDTVKVTVKVLNLAHQGMDLPIRAASLTADGITVPEPASTPLPSVKTSARLMWDISKNGLEVSSENTSGTVFGPAVASCPWAAAEACIRTSYMVLLSAPAGGKGAMPAVGDVTFVDDLSPAAMYPQLSPAQIAQIEAEPSKYGSLVTAGLTQGGWQYPWSKIGQNGSATATNSVRDSGSVSVTQASRGASATIRVSNADWSLRTVPSRTTAGNAIPANTATAASFVLHVYTPTAVIRDFGIQSAQSWTLPTMNKYTQLNINGFTANDHQGSADQPGPPSATQADTHWNDWRSTQPKLELPGGFRKDFVGAPGEPGNTPAADFRPTYPIHDGPAGSAGGWQTGGITVASTQNVVSQLWIGGSNSSLPADISVVACDAWDNDKLYLRAANYPALAAPTQTIASEGEAVWISGYNNVQSTSGSSRMAANASEAPELRVEYSAVAGGTGGDSTCGNDLDGNPATQDWFSSPQSVPGNDATLAGQGIYTAVSRVRVHLVLPEPVAPSTPINAGIVTAWVSIGLRVADSGQPTGTILPNWASQKRVNFAEATLEEVVAHAGAWTPSSYNPANHTGNYGDRLILAHAQARIDKEVRAGTSGAFSKTPPQVTGGDTVQYRLSPSLTSGAMTPGILKDVWVEDCLPASQTFSEASVAPVLVSTTFPADAKRTACAAGESYIRWVLPQQEVNQPIEPIVLTVEVSGTADDGVYTNTVVVWAQDDATPEGQRVAQAGIQISNIAGVKLEKVALTPVVQVNRPDQAVGNELNRWAIRLTNTLPASEQSGVSNPDIIDVLPKQGENGTVYNGAFTFVEAHVTQGGSDTRILYTSAASVSANPADPSNGASGATAWCDAPSGGTRVIGAANPCPASAAQVTALRVIRPVAYQPGDVIEVELSMLGVDNRAADRYVNRVMAQAQGLQYQVGPLNRPEVAIESKLGDYVWWDLNRDGVQNSFKGADEPVARGVTVRLSGTDDLGNPVALETTTDDDGRYLFEQLRSSNGDGYTVTFVKPAGSEFTAPLAGGDSGDKASDSNAAVDTGASAPVVLDRNARDYTIDAGLLPYGGVQIQKSLDGVGAGDFGADDELTFSVVCTFDDGLGGESGGEPNPVEVLNTTVKLPVNGAVQVLSDVIGGLPAYADCTIAEQDAGDADEAAAPVSVTIPWNGVTQRAGTPVASLTNFYSMGSVQVTKILEGDRKAVEQAQDLVFEVLVTCQIEVPDPENEGETLLADVYSGVVKIKGGQTKYLVDENDLPRGLPLGAKCFGEEVNTGGANQAVVDLDSWENSAEVTSGDPSELQLLTITAKNTFEDPPCTRDCLPITGAQMGGGALIGLGLLLAGVLFLIRRRRRTGHPDRPMTG